MTVPALPPRWIWDPEKARINRRKHGVSFETASLVFDDPLSVSQPDPYPYEPRWRTVGMVWNVVLLVVHTGLQGDPAIGRIITARKATSRERIAYEEGSF